MATPKAPGSERDSLLPRGGQGSAAAAAAMPPSRCGVDSAPFGTGGAAHAHAASVYSRYGTLTAAVGINSTGIATPPRRRFHCPSIKTTIKSMSFNEFRIASAVLGAGVFAIALALLLDDGISGQRRRALLDVPDVLLKMAITGFSLADVAGIVNDKTPLSGMSASAGSVANTIGASLAVARAAGAGISPGFANAATAFGIAGIAHALAFKIIEKDKPFQLAIPAFLGFIIAAISGGFALASAIASSADEQSQFSDLAETLTPASFVAIVASILAVIILELRQKLSRTFGVMTAGIIAAEGALIAATVLTAFKANPFLVLTLLGAATTCIAGIEYALHRPEPTAVEAIEREPKGSMDSQQLVMDVASDGLGKSLLNNRPSEGLLACLCCRRGGGAAGSQTPATP